MLLSDIESDFTFENFYNFCYNETYEMITSENLERTLTN